MKSSPNTEKPKPRKVAATIVPAPDGRRIIRGAVERRITDRYVVDLDTDGPTLTISTHGKTRT